MILTRPMKWDARPICVYKFRTCRRAAPMRPSVNSLRGTKFDAFSFRPP
jgi:hypothetical protein